MSSIYQASLDVSNLENALGRMGGKARSNLRGAIGAGLAVARAAAVSQSPGRTWATARGYKSIIKVTKDLTATGRLSAVPPGNIIQYGAKRHAAPLDRHVLAWMAAHNVSPTLKGIVVKGKDGRPHFVPFASNPRLQAWAQSHNRYQRQYYVFPAKGPRPWVVPAAQRVEDEALGAVQDKLLEGL